MENLPMSKVMLFQVDTGFSVYYQGENLGVIDTLLPYAELHKDDNFQKEILMKIKPDKKLSVQPRLLEVSG